MNDENARRYRDAWLPGLVGLIGVLLSLAAWGILVADRRAQLLAATRDTAAELGDAIESGLDQQLDTLRGLQALWRTYGLGPVDEWKANVGEQIDGVPGLDSVAFVDLEAERPRIAVGHAGSEVESPHDAEADAALAGGPRHEGPLRDATGGAHYRVLLPVETPEGHAGVLVARFSVAPFLEDVFRARARGYAVSVSWHDEEVFSRGEALAASSQAWWRVEEAVALPLGGAWQVAYRPTPEFAALRLTAIPHFLLAAGILLSVLLGALVHQLRVVARQSRFLEASNRALEQRGAELESRVAERTHALEEAVMELDAFNYSVSHDLRSPLGAILNFSAILEEDYGRRHLDDKGIELVQRIHRSATRATALLEDLLQLSRAGRAALKFEVVDMAALARETYTQVRVAEDVAEGAVEFVVEPLPDAFGDRVLLGGVFANLFSNALKYSRGCENRRILVRGRVEADECIFEVADNGNGFDMRFSDKLFGLFERLHSDDEIEGTGVGLAMVGRVIKRHAGRVWAEGTPGEGACFSFALPIQEPGAQGGSRADRGPS